MKTKTLFLLALLVGAVLGLGALDPVSVTTQWDTTAWKGSRVDWSKVEYGLRSDGVIVWRAKKN